MTKNSAKYLPAEEMRTATNNLVHTSTAEMPSCTYYHGYYIPQTIYTVYYREAHYALRVVIFRSTVFIPFIASGITVAHDKKLFIVRHINSFEKENIHSLLILNYRRLLLLSLLPRNRAYYVRNVPLIRATPRVTETIAPLRHEISDECAEVRAGLPVWFCSFVRCDQLKHVRHC